MKSIPVGTVVVGSIVVCGALIAWLYFGQSPNHQRGNDPIRLYCAAGLRTAVTEITEQYTEEFGIEFETTFAGSGYLRSELRAKKPADIYITADVHYVTDAIGQKLVDEVAPIAEQKMVVAVHPSVADKIGSLTDLLKEDIRLSLADPKGTAIGKKTKSALSKIKYEDTNLWDALYSHAVARRDKVNAVANDVKTRTVDAGIVWDTTAVEYKGIEVKKFKPLYDAPTSQIVVSIVKDCNQPTRALHFLRYMTAREKGLKAFENRAYSVVKGDKWSDTPEINLYTGGLMYPAIQASIEQFEKREGVRVNQTPNGCGILVAQIRKGIHPDAYFACDRSFMDRVEHIFLESKDLTSTEMVMIVNSNKQKDLKIDGLESLARKGLKVGLTSPDHSALGELSMNLLKRNNLWDSVKPNVVDWPSTADRLVEGVVIGSMDVAIVYQANTTRQADKLTVVPIDDEQSVAVQPIAVARDSDYRFLTERLLGHLRSRHAQKEFEKMGFHWLVDTNSKQNKKAGIDQSGSQQ